MQEEKNKKILANSARWEEKNHTTRRQEVRHVSFQPEQIAMSIWKRLLASSQVTALYPEQPELADHLPLAIRGKLGDFFFNKEFDSYDSPDGYKHFNAEVSKLLGTDPELKTQWSKWLKLPTSQDSKAKRHTQQTLFNFFRVLMEKESAILVEMQTDDEEKDDEEEQHEKVDTAKEPQHNEMPEEIPAPVVEPKFDIPPPQPVVEAHPIAADTATVALPVASHQQHVLETRVDSMEEHPLDHDLAQREKETVTAILSILRQFKK